MPVLDVTDASAVSPSKRARTETKPEDEKHVLRFSKISEHATTPTRGSAKAAGYDLYRLAFIFYTLSLKKEALLRSIVLHDPILKHLLNCHARALYIHCRLTLQCL